MEPNLQDTCEADSEEAQKTSVSVEAAQTPARSTTHINNDGLGSTTSDFHTENPAENCVRLEKEAICVSSFVEKDGDSLIGNTNKNSSFISAASVRVSKPHVANKTSGQAATNNRSPQKDKSLLVSDLKLTTNLLTTDGIASTVSADENHRPFGMILLQQSADVTKEKSKSANHSSQPTVCHATLSKSAVIRATITSKDTNLHPNTLVVSEQSTCEIEGQWRKGGKDPLIDHLNHSAADENIATVNESEIKFCLAPDPLLVQQNTDKKQESCIKDQNSLMRNPEVDLFDRSVNGCPCETSANPVNAPKKRGRKPKSAVVTFAKEIPSHGNSENGCGPEVGTLEPVLIPKKQARKPKNTRTVSQTSKGYSDAAENDGKFELGAPQPANIPKKRGRKLKNAKKIFERIVQQIPSKGLSDDAKNDSNNEVVIHEPVKILTKRGRKPKNAEAVAAERVVLQAPTAGSNISENGGVTEIDAPPPMQIPKKRGRKPKNKMVPQEDSTDTHGLLKPIVQRLLEESNTDNELTASGRPKRRAARAALLYLHEIVEEIKSPSYKVDDVAANINDCEPDHPLDQSLSQPPSSQKQRKRRKRQKINDVFDDMSDDKDFVISDEGTDEEEDEEFIEVEPRSVSSESDLGDFRDVDGQKQRSLINKQSCSTKRRLFGNFANGLPNTIMVPVWEATTITRKHESLRYLPNEGISPMFKIKREGLRENSVIQRLRRFQSLPAHKDRWDINFFVGGPVWCVEWCPTPEGSAACQYAAIYCNKRMDDRHKLMDQYTEPTLLQIWQLGDLQQEQCPQMNAALAYGIATEYGCIWDMKWCPSGAWELPETTRKIPQMARLGMLAAAFSSGKVVVYSLPHPKSLNTYKMKCSKGSTKNLRLIASSGNCLCGFAHSPRVCVNFLRVLRFPPTVISSSIPGPVICKVQCTVILEIGSVQFSGSSQCGQCFCLDWMPTGEHEYLAAGFYDGTVALWNLNTTSLLLRVQQGDGTLRVFPFHCFVAHDHAVKAIAWSKAHSNFLVTASPDRKIKFWDLRRTYQPINEIKRYLNTEVAWLLPWCGVMVAQENCYAAFGLSGIHYVDAGFLGFKPYFAAPRAGTVWSISGSDWLNTCVSGDNTGEVIAVILPDCMNNTMNIKRPNERRFPVYKADVIHHNAGSNISVSCLHQKEKEANAEKHSSEMEEEDSTSSPVIEPKTYSDTVKKYYLTFDDTDLRNFKNMVSREPFKRIQKVDKAKTHPDRMPLESVYKVRFNPNLDAHGWVLSAGQSGIVRAHCVQSLNTHVSKKLIKECRAQFSSMFQPTEVEDVENSTK
ncbi:general transcription factor 3C polypeptide 2 isoform X2 [Stegostoma tigrinum]|uniref:general transcription factor 3C polypeptide 2 isoform X2 n=1 Tax=Stegostoma tigrinum TaxID=3053191 RepID=UPI00287019FA|nr:general transcription factor 3C polypeptide 2 isoform X2 [Stegostoma tigrinum]